MWLLPTKGRIASLRRLFRACREYGVTTPCLILINRIEWDIDQELYENLDRPEHWHFHPVDADSMHGALRAAWPLISDRDWVGLLQDDLLPSTPGWDDKLVKALKGWNVVSSHDGLPHAQRMHGAIAWSGELLREMGWFYPPELSHLYGDDVWESLNAETHCWQVLNDVVTRHLNQTYLLDADKTAVEIRERTEADKEAFQAWAAANRQACVDKIKALQRRKGIIHYSVDFHGVLIMLATPTADGRLDGGYVDGMLELAQRVTAGGGNVQWTKEPRNSDISLARARLFGEFVRSKCTHMLMIDSDMGWEHAAVVRLFAAKKDFVAIAGPKKFYPLTFAANFSNAEGDLLPLRLNIESGCSEVNEVGLAFALITRACAELMVRSYPELTFEDATSQTCHALFNPLVINGRYFSEDFAFCRRYRLAGGTPYICPDVPLSHVGDHRFKGALTEHNTIKKRPPSPDVQAAN